MLPWYVVPFLIAIGVLIAVFLGCDFAATWTTARRPITTRDVRAHERWRFAALLALLAAGGLALVGLLSSLSWSRP